jgi:hypothetical protein
MRRSQCHLPFSIAAFNDAPTAYERIIASVNSTYKAFIFINNDVLLYYLFYFAQSYVFKKMFFSLSIFFICY